jgi:hypothetical protein
VESVAKSGGAWAGFVAKGGDAQPGAGAFSQAWEIYRDGAEEGRRAALGSPPPHRRDEFPTGYSSAGCSPCRRAGPPPLHRPGSIVKLEGARVKFHISRAPAVKCAIGEEKRTEKTEKSSCHGIAVSEMRYLLLPRRISAIPPSLARTPLAMGN